MKKENEPEIDESLLTPGQKAELKKTTFNWKWGLFWGIILVLMMVAVIVILTI